MRRPARAGSARARVADEIRERRLVECRRTVEEFVVGLALIMSGHAPALDHCATRSLVARVRTALQPVLAADDLVRPDFGSHGELRIDADLLDVAQPARAWVEFDDRSMRQAGDRRVAVPRKRVRLELVLSLQPCQVMDMTVHLSAAG